MNEAGRIDAETLTRLMTAVARGDRQAFATVFHHVAPRIAAYLMQSGTAPTTAEELTQEAMLAVWRKAGSFDPTRGTASAWVFAIARNLRTDRRRLEAVENPYPFSLDEHDVADAAPSPDERLFMWQRERRIRAALGRLSPLQAQVLRLSYFAERPHPDIARDLRLPLGTVKSHIRRAVIQLRRLLEGSES